MFELMMHLYQNYVNIFWKITLLHEISLSSTKCQGMVKVKRKALIRTMYFT